METVGAIEITLTWKTLSSQALGVIGGIGKHGREDLFLSFGAGIVLMLRHGHRFSKDIGIRPRSPAVRIRHTSPYRRRRAITTDYVETSGYTKLYLPEGELNFVRAPNLTSPGFTSQIGCSDNFIVL